MTCLFQNLIEKYRKDYDDISVHIVSSASRSVSMDGLELENAEFADSTRYYVRCLREGRVLTSAFTGADGSVVEDFLKQSASVIGSMPADDLRFMPAYSAPSAYVEAYDKAYEKVTMENLIETAGEITETAMASDKRVKAVKQAGASASKNSTVLISTAGPVLSFEQTVFSAGAYLIASDGEDERDGYDQVSSVMKSGLDHIISAKYAAENACSLLGARQIKSGRYHIVFSASVMAEFLELLLDLTDGENIYKGLSMLAGKKGKKVASDGFTLTDDPLLKLGISSRASDDEGQPSEIIEIISGGVLNSYLHNSYTAKALGEEGNGRAVLSGGGNISVGCTNVSIATTAPGTPDKYAGEYLKITEVMGMHTADPVSGNFSVGISGVYYKDSMPAYPFREAVISGSLKDLLSGMIHVFDNRRTFGNITTADTLFDKMSVSGV